MEKKIWRVKNLDPESDSGNHEYKLKLSHSSPDRIEQMTSQMRYRLEEGNGEAFYTLGVTDNGELIGLTKDEYEESRKNLQIIASKNNYTLSVLSEQVLDETRTVYEFLVRENNENKYIDIRVACAGNVDAGKSSLLGVLLSGENDNGRGGARLNVMNFQHEIKSGRTSSVAQHILGFDNSGKVTNYDGFSMEMERKKTWPEIVKNSSKIVTFFDLCGHEKYLKTTISGLTSNFPDLVFILIGANMGVSKMTKEHIFLCLSLHIPFVIIVTKIDICKDRQNILQETVTQIKKLVKSTGVQRLPYDVKTEEDIMVAIKNINSLSTVPIFYVSNVTGEGINEIKSFLNLFQKRQQENKKENKVELYVDQLFHVTGVGTVVGGQLVNGKIKVGDTLLVGPNNNSFNTIHVKSIHCKRVNTDQAEAGCYVCIGIKKTEAFRIRRGNCIISPVDRPVQVREFEAEVAVLKSHSTTIKPGYQPILHTCAVRQAATIVEIRDKKCGRNKEEQKDDILRSGDRAVVKFRFFYRPEYVKRGFRILLAEGPIKIIGKITALSEDLCKT